MADQISRMDVQFSPFPLGFCPSDFNAFGTALAANLTVTPAFGFYGVAYGPTAPSDTDLVWFNTIDNDWYYYSTVTATWLPVRPVAITGEVQIGSLMFWDGQVALVSQFWGDKWLFANGDPISRTLYPDYFGLVGTKWGAGDGSTTFNIIDARNYFIVGADTDTASEATTTISDGSTPTTQRPYTTHVHAQGDPSIVGDGKTAGNSYSSIELDTSSDATARVPTRVLPPYKAAVPLVRVK